MRCAEQLYDAVFVSFLISSGQLNNSDTVTHCILFTLSQRWIYALSFFNMQLNPNSFFLPNYHFFYSGIKSLSNLYQDHQN